MAEGEQQIYSHIMSSVTNGALAGAQNSYCLRSWWMAFGGRIIITVPENFGSSELLNKTAVLKNVKLWHFFLDSLVLFIFFLSTALVCMAKIKSLT